jgi:hypothetical protein
MGDKVTTCSRPTPGGIHNHHSSEGGRRSYDSPEAIPRPETQSHLAQGQPQAREEVTTCPRLRDAVMTRSRPGDAVTTCPRQRDAATTRPRPTRVGDVVTISLRATLGGRCSHKSPESNLGRETQS